MSKRIIFKNMKQLKAAAQKQEQELARKVVLDNCINLMFKLQECISTLESNLELDEHQSAFLGTIGVIEDLSYKPEDSFTWEDEENITPPDWL